MFRHETIVSFGDCDPAGVLFYAALFAHAHRALEQFLPALGIPWSEWFASPTHMVPILHAEADYRGPLYPGSPLFLALRVLRVGNSSVRFGYTFEGPTSFCATAETVHAFISLPTRTSIAIPKPFKDLLEANRLAALS